MAYLDQDCRILLDGIFVQAHFNHHRTNTAHGEGIFVINKVTGVVHNTKDINAHRQMPYQKIVGIAAKLNWRSIFGSVD